MKKTFANIFALAAVCGSMLTSCTKEEGDFRSLIQGDWTLVRTLVSEITDGVEGELREGGTMALRYSFGKRNQWEMDYPGLHGYSLQKGTWKLRGNKLTLTIPASGSDEEDLVLVRTVEDLSETTLVLSYTSELNLSSSIECDLTRPFRLIQTFKRGDIELDETERMLEGGWQVVDGSVRVVNYGEASIFPLLGEGEACYFGFSGGTTWCIHCRCAALAALWRCDTKDGDVTLLGLYTVEGNRLTLDNSLSSYSGDHENPPCFTIEQLAENDLQLSIDLDPFTTGEAAYVTRITIKLKKALGSIN